MKKLFIRLSVITLAICMALLAGCGNSGKSSEGIGIHHVEIEVENYGTIALELDGTPLRSQCRISWTSLSRVSMTALHSTAS